MGIVNRQTGTMAKNGSVTNKNGHKSSGPLLRTLKRFYYRFLRIRGTPHQVAMGLALGVFVGMTPFLGIHTVIAVMLASVFKLSKISAGIGVFITNPFTAPLIYPLTYRIGTLVIGFSDPSQWHNLFQSGGVIALMKDSPSILFDLMVGGGILGLFLAVITYYVTFHLVARARRRLEERKARRMVRKAALLRSFRRKTRAKEPDAEQGRQAN